MCLGQPWSSWSECPLLHGSELASAAWNVQWRRRVNAAAAGSACGDTVELRHCYTKELLPSSNWRAMWTHVVRGVTAWESCATQPQGDPAACVCWSSLVRTRHTQCLRHEAVVGPELAWASASACNYAKNERFNGTRCLARA